MKAQNRPQHRKEQRAVGVTRGASSSMKEAVRLGFDLGLAGMGLMGLGDFRESAVHREVSGLNKRLKGQGRTRFSCTRLSSAS